ncbi:helix-turn-helix transcriptional regulator [Streptomyces sp. NPDC005811]|uniref:helix-turn-helix domain-containing protein n=1 Tax=Streptomyces sp. NPDC005811 TaxID=3154565 RepID=UPI00340D17E7
MSTEDDVEQFAALLRRLKNRSDRSYGSLARRLHMNTSTLHRYCAGEAVPQDYAPVERLAAFCGATPEERLDLHRLWLLAMTARQRPRTGAEAAGPTPSEGAPEPDGRTAGRADEGTRSDTRGPGGPGPGGPESSAPGDAARSTGRPWYRRRRALVGAAAATVLLATLGSVSALSADRSHEPKEATSSDTNSASPVPTDVPLAWTADSQIWDGGCGHDYVIAKEPARVPPPPVQQDAEVWAATQQAVPGRQTTVQISVQGTSSTAVVLEALRVRVVSRGAPVTGNAYAMGQGCGSDLPPRHFSVDLDVDRPIAHARPGNDSGKPFPAVRFPYRVSAEDPEVVEVTATTESYDCTWYLELDWSSQGRTGTVRIDDHGRPFRTSGIKGLPHYWYGTNVHNARQWVPTDS